MIASGLEDPSVIVVGRAAGYRRTEEGDLINAPFVDLSGRLPGDGMLSTVEDLARFALAFQGQTLIRDATRELMVVEQKTTSGEGTGYGLGCFVRSEDGRRLIGHGGWQPQTSAFLLIVPDEGVAVALLANLEGVEVRRIALAVVDLLSAHGEKGPPPKREQPKAPPPPE